MSVTKEEYKRATPAYDDDGNIVILGETVMYADEEAYIKKSIKEIYNRTNFNSVIEIGFGFGYTADEIQKKSPKKHIIIEANEEIYDKALIWAKDKKNIQIINSRWQDVELEEVDLLYYDAYEMVTPEDMIAIPNSKDFSNLPHKWYAEFCTPEVVDRGEYFSFESDGITYYQKLVRGDVE